MTLCNQCGCPVPPSRYGAMSTLCAQCVEEYDEYYRNEPEDDLEQPTKPCPDCYGRPVIEGRQRDGSDTFWECPTCQGTGRVPDPDATQGKRPDQVAYSGGVLIVGIVLLALLMAGLSIGAWVAYWTTPLP